MRIVVILLFLFYTYSAMAVDKHLLTSFLLASDTKDYIEPKISILEFKKLVNEVAFCESNTESELIELGDNLLKIQFKVKDSLSGKDIPNEFTISYFKHDGKYNAFLQTHDRGPAHIFDDQRFIPSSQIVDIVRILANNCGKQL